MTEQQQTETLQKWMKDHQPLFFKVVRAYAFTRADQDDLFQEVAIQVWRSIPGFREQSAVSTWLYRIALNTAMKWTRRELKHRQGTYDHVEYLLQQNIQQEDSRLAWLYEQITHLNEIDRSLTLLLLDGFSYKEMSEILGISESNIGIKIHRIKQHLISKSKDYNNGI
ncbi:RNA polymerase ECF-type sigma factor [Fulvivirga imtechensis AK7]|uniref:RNA polymerase ECF-type sigma factor n=1 Tax=Fulvivirga imtechensis AK7 TaxID=1237149 RepID=L8JJN4_9BACT|nr:RNA polymerase sigma factor [Fulvivirga imtechensis]ELR68458.1 RNA polymerase ECF-type sigma factor [Fulvivirga imtechensis AK7]